MKQQETANIKLTNIWEMVCLDANGNEKWREEKKNLVTNAGLNDLLDKYLKGSGYTAAWYAGIKGTGTAVAADTMASHASWSELTGYTQSARPTLTLGSVSGQSVDNSASKATFSVNASATVAGAFLNSDSTKSGTTGTLYGVVDFSSSRSVISGDTLEVTVTLTAASA